MGQARNTMGFVIFLSLSIGSVIASLISVMSIFRGGLGLIGIHLTIFILTGTFVIFTLYFFKKIFIISNSTERKMKLYHIILIISLIMLSIGIALIGLKMAEISETREKYNINDLTDPRIQSIVNDENDKILTSIFLQGGEYTP